MELIVLYYLAIQASMIHMEILKKGYFSKSFPKGFDEIQKGAICVMKTKKKSAETYLKINLEAAKETARQIRLRNISGIILIDFINMDDPDMMQELLKQFRRFLGEDPIQTSVVDVTALQLVEVTRKKVRRPLHECVRDKAEKSPERSEHVE